MRKVFFSIVIIMAIILGIETTVNAVTIDFYDKDGGTRIGRMEYVYNTLTNITVDIPAKLGYAFAKWASNSTNVTLSDDNTQVAGPYNWYDLRNLGTILNVYATWELVDYNINVDLQGGTAETNPTTYTIEDQDITLNNPVKTGYEFVGWTDETGGDLRTTATIPAGSTGDKTFIAVWNPIVYTINYELDGGTVTGNPDEYTVEDTFTLNNPTKVNYSFIGWTSEDGTDLGTTVTIAQGTTGDKTYTAKWEAIPADEARSEAEGKSEAESEVEGKTINNPPTGDSILVYEALLAIAAIGIVVFRKLTK